MAEAIRGQLNDNFGRPISDATITVYKTGTLVAADLFADAALTSGVSNPIASELDGSYLAFAPNGVYDLVFAKAGYSFDSTDSVGEVLFDPHITRSVSVSGPITDKDYVLLVNATAAPVVLSLPALSTVAEGRPFVVIKTDGTVNAVTIDPNGAEQIGGAATLALTAVKQGVIFAKGGSEWVTYQPVAQEVSGAGKIPIGRAVDGKLDPTWFIAPEVFYGGAVSAGTSAVSTNTFSLAIPMGMNTAAIVTIEGGLGSLAYRTFLPPSTWSLTGGLGLGSVTAPSISALSATRIAYIDATNDQLRAYDWSGSAWSLTGSGLNITGIGGPSLTALNSTDVVLYDSSLGELRVYRFSGSSWSQVGSSFSLGTGTRYVAALSATQVVVGSQGADTLAMYNWSGSAFSLAGSTSGITNLVFVCAVSSTDVAVKGSGVLASIWRWNGSGFVQVSPLVHTTDAYATFAFWPGGMFIGSLSATIRTSFLIAGFGKPHALAISI